MNKTIKTYIRHGLSIIGYPFALAAWAWLWKEAIDVGFTGRAIVQLVLSSFFVSVYTWAIVMVLRERLINADDAGVVHNKNSDKLSGSSEKIDSGAPLE